MLVFATVIIEFLLFWNFVDRIGFWQTMSYYWLPTFLAILIFPAALNSLKILQNQILAAPTQNANRALRRLLFVFGLLLFMIPFWSVRFLGLIIQIPGVAPLFLRRLQRKWGQRVFSSGPLGNHFQFYYTHYKENQDGFEEHPTIKDVTPSQSPPSLRIPKSD